MYPPNISSASDQIQTGVLKNKDSFSGYQTNLLAVCVQLGYFVAVASTRFKPNKTTSDMYSSFDIGRVLNVLEGSYSLLMYKRAPNGNIYVPNVLSKTIEVLHIDIRYYFEDRTKNLDSPVVLDIKIVQNIILNCFDGRM
jgi:hypothetical protein